ncbi:MAG TPA: hypothetical protein VGC79_26180 [Polyangiaceae bacterium]
MTLPQVLWDRGLSALPSSLPSSLHTLSGGLFLDYVGAYNIDPEHLFDQLHRSVGAELRGDLRGSNARSPLEN